MNPLVFILICITVSYLLAEFLILLRLPRVLAPIVVGIGLTTPVIHDLFFTTGDANLSLLESFSQLGLIFLMFYVGLTLDFEGAKKNKESIYTGLLSGVVSFVFGFIATILLFKFNLIPQIIPSLGIKVNTWLAAVVVGGCLSITAEEITLDILDDLKMLNTKLGKTILSAGILDDIFEILLITGLLTLSFVTAAAQTSYAVLSIAFGIVFFIALILIAKFIFIPFILGFLKTNKKELDLFIIALIFGLFMSVAAEHFQLGLVLGAILAGLMLGNALSKKKELHKLKKKLSSVVYLFTYGLLAPFFFIWVGMSAPISVMFSVPLLAIGITILAFGGKIFGAMLGSKLSKDTWSNGALIGLGLNARGAIELVAAKIALDINLITPQLFSALVFMAVFTTILSPVLFTILAKKLIKKNTKKPKKRKRRK